MLIKHTVCKEGHVLTPEQANILVSILLSLKQKLCTIEFGGIICKLGFSLSKVWFLSNAQM